MTLALYTAIAQTALAATDDLSQNTTAAIDRGLIRPADGQAIQNVTSLLRHLVGQALANGTEASVQPSDRQQTRVLGHVTGDRPK